MRICFSLVPIVLTAILCHLAVEVVGGEKKQLRPAKLGKTKPVHRFDGIYLAGQPSPSDLKIAKKLGVKTVVNLRTAPELKFNERKVVESLGMNYYHLPFLAPATLTDSVFDKVRQVLKDRKHSPVLLHCASANRVGAVWLVHRVLDDRVDFDAALSEARQIGLRTPAYLEKARQYIARHRRKNN